MAVDLSPYSSAAPFFGPAPTWVQADDAKRIQSYELYEAIYRNVPEAFKIVQRGTDANPIYIPNARTLIEAKNRYFAKRWDFTLDPRIGTDGDRQVLGQALRNLFAREVMYAKFGTQKRWGMIRGDAVWHVVADPAKAPGKRISLFELNPGSYFPIPDPWNTDSTLGAHLVSIVKFITGESVARRQTYRKLDDGTITYEMTWWEPDGWDDRPDSTQVLKPAKKIPPGDANAPVPVTVLPSAITALPVYHVKNSRLTGAEFGSSELEGFERIIGAVNQAISDEEMTLALDGLGLYSTTSGPPVDDDGNETNWKIGPGWVVEIDEGATFGRINGVGTVSPVLDHIHYIEGAMRQAAGVPDIAIGTVDVATAESGIALAFKMAPILAGNEEKEVELLGVMDHLLYDLSTMWLPTFEGMSAGLAQAVSVIDDPMPVDRAAILDEVTKLMATDPPLISAEYARTLLAEKLGYEFPDELGATVVTEAAAYADARLPDPFNIRSATELAAGVASNGAGG